jgi:hypothetical protein
MTAELESKASALVGCLELFIRVVVLTCESL